MKNLKPKTIETACMGIPVIYDPAMENPISNCRGIFRWKKIFVGPAFMRFPPREQAALLIHEVGHCKMFHLEKRILAALALVFWPPALVRLCNAQEFQADLFAAHCGYGRDLANAFLRVQSAEPIPLHPPIAERIARLLP